MRTIVTAKGQIVIPSEVCRQLGIKEGMHLQIEVDADAGKIILTPVTDQSVQSLRGKYKGKGLMRALLAEKLRERG